ncbi:hypothetical protein Tcan_01765 [Toxocara canis]|uniref:Uncharacterized protein n=1 Tax=Toxocara canis TaxID=6265 RepID=A0A0B2VQT6_TOXCA|nr:hypothetical protein Tcan_01765 [Toxocara canis]
MSPELNNPIFLTFKIELKKAENSKRTCAYNKFTSYRLKKNSGRLLSKNLLRNDSMSSVFLSVTTEKKKILYTIELRQENKRRIFQKLKFSKDFQKFENIIQVMNKTIIVNRIACCPWRFRKFGTSSSVFIQFGWFS